jgi:hypothetical protein
VQTLLDLQESMGITPKALDERPKLEGHLVVGHSIFNEVASGRRYASSSPLRLGPAEILAYVQLHNVRPAEVEAIADTVQLFDDAWFDAETEQRREKNPQTEAKK